MAALSLAFCAHTAYRITCMMPAPVQVTVGVRELTSAEAEARTQRMNALFGIEDD
jgi:hypothetical protein